jgi:glycerate 2-kinase
LLLSSATTLSLTATNLREHALAIAAGAIGLADAGLRVEQAMASVADAIVSARRWHVIAAGKAAGPMLRACLSAVARPPASAMAVAPGGLDQLPDLVRRFAGGHPVPNQASMDAGRCATGIAEVAGADDVVMVLVSGGASALLVHPIEGVSLADKQNTTARLLRAGADIHALNTVRKHLSSIKGGRLAAATAARVVSLVVSDVVGDDLSAIGSGLTAGDPTSFGDALRLLDQYGGADAFPPAAVAALRDGAAGRLPESPAPGSPALSRTRNWIIGSRRDAMTGARVVAERLGYAVDVIDEPVVGEARVAADAYAARLRDIVAHRPLPRCIVSSGETTVRVTGSGLGGRNQEFALALVDALPGLGGAALVASLGTDGIDGPTAAAGAIVASDTRSRADAAHLSSQAFLDNNDAYHFFDALADLIRTGPTRTNVGDLQIALIVPHTETAHL